MTQWHDIGSFASLKEDEPRGVTVENIPIGIFKVGQACYAIHDVCPHQFVRLSKGFLEGSIVECPLHEAKFDLATGRCLEGPTEEDVAVYETKVDGDRLWVKV
ncbi:MAG: Rieske (2Fe-2S) protein [Janthinobacterium lividum]